MIVPVGYRKQRYRHYGSKIPTRGWGPFRYDWFSICSRHQDHDPSCILCKQGSWMNHWKWLIGQLIYLISPPLWMWWVNRKH